MPRLKDTTMESHRIGGGTFTFQGTRLERLLLGATEYTLVTIAVDETGSVGEFSKELRDMLIMAVESCKRSPRSDNLLLRVITFGSQHKKGVNEIHGFKLLSEVDSASYPEIIPGGMTPLCDACYSSIGATNAYGKDLSENDFGVNAITFVITDGGENASTATMKMVKDEAEKSVSGEFVESMISVLIGINDDGACADFLKEFQSKAGITHYISAGEATKAKLVKLAGFISRSISSQSQELGTGGPSKNISATI